jgi:hypothetical protein
VQGPTGTPEQSVKANVGIPDTSTGEPESDGTMVIVGLILVIILASAGYAALARTNR